MRTRGQIERTIAGGGKSQGKKWEKDESSLCSQQRKTFRVTNGHWEIVLTSPYFRNYGASLDVVATVGIPDKSLHADRPGGASQDNLRLSII